MHFPYRKIKEDPLFQPKRSTSVLVLADFCAYVVKRIVMNNDDPIYSRFYDAFRKRMIVFEGGPWDQSASRARVRGG